MRATMLSLVAAVIFAGPAFSDDTSQIEASIRRVEGGLRPSVMYEGQPTWTIAERMRRFKVPGISIAVVSHGKLLWARGYGVTAAMSRPIDTGTLFQAASITKPVSALMALTLVDDGLVSLDENVNEKLRSWHVPESPLTKEHAVTLRGLLSHTAGLNVSGFPGYPVGAKLPSLLDLLQGSGGSMTEALQVKGVPGTEWRYSGGGYEIIEQLAVDIAAKPFTQLTQERILDPLGMTRSYYAQPLPLMLQANAARAHHGGGAMVDGGARVYPELAAAGLWTTPTDLGRVISAIHSGSVLKPGTRAEMLKSGLGDYGLGFEIGHTAGRVSITHSGGNLGFNCLLFGYVDDGSGAVIMTNSDYTPVIHEIMRSIAAEYHWPDFETQRVTRLEPDLLRRYVGRYVFPGENREVLVTFENGKLFMETSGERTELVSLSPDKFVSLDFGGPLAQFFPAADGTMQMTAKGMTARRQ